jgi:phosphoesterase RecJ-like protein
LGRIAFARVGEFISLSVQIFIVLKNTGNEIFNSIGKVLDSKPEDVVIVPHENPDGDAIGSAIGLGEILRNHGHKVSIISPNDYPEFLKWFSTEIEILVYERKKKQAKKLLENAGVLICVDFNEPKRAAKMEKLLTGFSGPKIMIDHHPNPSNCADYLVSEPKYSSTAELIFDVAKKIGFEKHLNREAAEALYTGIMTDTGSFSHNISNPNTFRVIAELIGLGVDPDKIQSNIYHNFSANRMRLLGHCLNNKMEIFPEHRAAMIYISQKELEEYNFQPGDTEGFVNYPLSVNNIVFSALFIEKKDFIKASFRSKGDFPANEFSKKHFSGGGHLNAAGGETKLTLDETIDKFRQLLDDYKHLLVKTMI